VRVTLRPDGLRRTALLCSYALLAAVGELNLLKFGIGVPLYDPMVHYQQFRDAGAGVRTPEGY
jgi:outer membrane protein